MLSEDAFSFPLFCKLHSGIYHFILFVEKRKWRRSGRIELLGSYSPTDLKSAPSTS